MATTKDDKKKRKNLCVSLSLSIPAIPTRRPDDDM
jgi:hypothetical protein